MIHRAPFGSLERFIGILIEHFAGAFPLWLAPVQVAVLPVSEKVDEYAASVADQLRQARPPRGTGRQSRQDRRQDPPGHAGQDPYMAVVGAREAQGATVAVRHRTAGDLGAMPTEAFLRALRAEIDSKGATPLASTKGP